MTDEVVTIKPDVEVSIVETEEVVEVEVGIQGPPGPPGAQGPQGEPGIPGLSGASYVHDQAVASADWLIAHNLGRFPSVTVVDSAGTTCFGDVTYVSANEVSVHFSAGFSGKAYLN